jgi:DNA primase
MNPHPNDAAKELVRQRLNIADIVGRYVALKPRGRAMVGLCPFHNEKTPSFQVNPELGVYYCFGCGKGGDLFSFVQDMDGVSFPEALEALALEARVEIPRYDRREAAGAGGTPPGAASKAELLEIHKSAAEFYYKCLRDSPQAIGYLKSRGLSAETVKEFGLGYAPDGRQRLIDYLAGEGVSRSKAVECGLAAGKEGGAPYDRFRNRVIFPLCDLSGRVIAFAGRGLDAATEPKYLNSPESALYKKSGVLYGLHKARDGIREHGYVVVVEGYMDYLTLYQAGIRNAVAASGTAFTADHARLIKRLASKAALVFDGDRAGLAAAKRAALLLAPFSVQAAILALPDGEDPDSFVKGRGADAFRALLAKAPPAADFLIGQAAAEFDRTPYGKGKAIEELAPYARALSDDIAREDFVEKLARHLGLDKRLVANKTGGKIPAAPGGGVAGAGAALGVEINPLERDFLRLLAASPKLIAEARECLPPNYLTAPAAENIYSIMLAAHAKDGNLSGLLDACGGDPELRRAAARLSADPPHGENLEEEFIQKVLLLRRKGIKARMADAGAALVSCPEGEKGQLMEIIRQYSGQLKELGLRE